MGWRLSNVASWRDRKTVDGLLGALGIYVVSRLAVLAIAGFCGILNPNLSLYRWFLRWDSGWFVELIAKGYPSEVPVVDGKVAQSTIAFFPGYPLIARSISEVFGISATVAAAVTSFLLGVATTVLLWRLVQVLYDEETATRASALFWFFPGSVVLSLAYSEALMIPAALACILLLLDRKWLLAGLAAAVVTSSRSNGIVIIGVCLWAAGYAIYERREWRALIAPALAPLGVIAFHLYLWQHTGMARAWFRTQSDAWAEKVDFGARVWDRAWLTVTNPSQDLYSVVTTVGTVITIAGIALLIRQRARTELILFAVGMALTAVLSQTIGLRPRFMLSAFPIIIAFAVWARGWRFSALLGVFAMLLTMFTVMAANSLLLAP